MMTTNTKLVALLLLLAAALPAAAQNSKSTKTNKTLQQKQDAFDSYRAKKQQAFTTYRDNKRQEFEAYRRKKNEDFAAYVRKKWEAFDLHAGKARPKEPKPVQPPKVEPKVDIKPVKPTPIPHGDVQPLVKPVKPKPIEVPPLPKEDVKEDQRVALTFLGTANKVTLTRDMRISLSDGSENGVGNAMQQLAGDKYAPLVADCSAIQRKMKLNGWATFKLCETIAQKMQGGSGNEAVLVQTWLMNQLGYNVRLARTDGGRLLTLCPFAMPAYTFPYMNIEGTTYYVLDKTLKQTQIFTYRTNMKDATLVVDFENPTRMVLANRPAQTRRIASRKYPQAAVTVSVNKNLIDYYATEPYFSGYSWGFYARQPLSDEVMEQLLPPLRQALAGKDEVQQVSVLMDFMQFGFDYATDEEQFGYEKPFFFEENFFYPKNDCEDRAILLSYLVRKLVGLDAVLLYAPGHLWMAVGFNREVPGDYVTVGNKKYVVCDPTYIGASIGMTQPPYVGKSPVVVRCQ